MESVKEMKQALSIRIIVAIALTLAIPVGGAALDGFAAPGVLRCFLICLFPLVLVIDPPFLRSVFRSHSVAVAVGWIGYGSVAFQVFLLPPLLRSLLRGR